MTHNAADRADGKAAAHRHPRSATGVGNLVAEKFKTLRSLVLCD